eukprot:260569-Rhodomonas_salina.2
MYNLNKWRIPVSRLQVRCRGGLLRHILTSNSRSTLYRTGVTTATTSEKYWHIAGGHIMIRVCDHGTIVGLLCNSVARYPSIKTINGSMAREHPKADAAAGHGCIDF